MKTITFEEFLQEWFLRSYHDSKDYFDYAFETWLSSLDTISLVELADLAIIDAEKRGIERGSEIAVETMNQVGNIYRG